jgi:Laminin B (Domain IV)
MRSRIPQLIIGLFTLLLSSCGALITISNVNIHGPSTAPANGKVLVYANANSSRAGLFGGSPNVAWSIVSGGATLGQTTGATAVIVLPTATIDGTVTVRATAVDDSSKSGDAIIRVIAPNSTLPKSDFSTSNDDWEMLVRTNANDPDSINPFPIAATYIASQGNPGGHIETYANGLKYFAAPGRFLGPQSKTLGKILKFDLLFLDSMATSNTEDIVLQGGGLKLVAPFPVAPTSNWTSVSVALGVTGGWRVGGTNGTLATEVQIATALEFVDGLWIRGGVASTGIPITGNPPLAKLDNVRFEP